jgi:hypothetical protein
MLATTISICGVSYAYRPELYCLVYFNKHVYFLSILICFDTYGLPYRALSTLLVLRVANVYQYKHYKINHRSFLIPRIDGAILSLEWKETIWGRYGSGASRPRSSSELQNSDRKLRARRYAGSSGSIRRQ